MRVLTAQAYNSKNESFADIELPASYEELQDTLQIVNGSNENCSADIRYFLGDFNPFEGKTIQPYGMLIPDDGIKLSEQLQKQTEDMEITISM